MKAPVTVSQRLANRAHVLQVLDATDGMLDSERIASERLGSEREESSAEAPEVRKVVRVAASLDTPSGTASAPHARAPAASGERVKWRFSERNRIAPVLERITSSSNKSILEMSPGLFQKALLKKTRRQRLSQAFGRHRADLKEWDDLLSTIGLADTMERLSSYYQNNAILAGLIASILFSMVADGHLFDLERGSMACPYPAGAAGGGCMQTLANYEPSQLMISHYIFYISGYLGECRPRRNQTTPPVANAAARFP